MLQCKVHGHMANMLCMACAVVVVMQQPNASCTRAQPLTPDLMPRCYYKTLTQTRVTAISCLSPVKSVNHPIVDMLMNSVLVCVTAAIT